MGRVSVSVWLRQPPADVWARAIDPDWINDELRPLPRVLEHAQLLDLGARAGDRA